MFGELLDGGARGPLQGYKPRAEGAAIAQSFRIPHSSPSTLIQAVNLEPINLEHGLAYMLH